MKAGPGAGGLGIMRLTHQGPAIGGSQPRDRKRGEPVGVRCLQEPRASG